MWMQQRTVSILIVVMAGCSALFLCYVIVVSSASPDSSFQTSISLFIQRTRDARRCLEDDVHLTVSAMTWILDTSTKPDVLRSVLDLMIIPSHNVLSTQLVEKVLNMFKACFAGSATEKTTHKHMGEQCLTSPTIIPRRRTAFRQSRSLGRWISRNRGANCIFLRRWNSVKFYTARCLRHRMMQISFATCRLLCVSPWLPA